MRFVVHKRRLDTPRRTAHKSCGFCSLFGADTYLLKVLISIFIYATAYPCKLNSSSGTAHVSRICVGGVGHAESHR